jgi:hypothetical protein
VGCPGPLRRPVERPAEMITDGVRRATEGGWTWLVRTVARSRSAAVRIDRAPAVSTAATVDIAASPSGTQLLSSHAERSAGKALSELFNSIRRYGGLGPRAHVNVGCRQELGPGR